MADNALRGRVLGFSWDGAGYGPDGTIWGGEFLLATEVSFSRIGHFRAFRLPGGEKAIKEPRRAAIGVLYELFGENLFKMNHLLPVQAFLELPGRQDYKEYEEQINSTRSPLVVIERMLAKGLNTPLTSSAGRLFDAIASLVGLRQCVSFEGQAAMELEFAMKGRQTEADYPFQILDSKSSIIIDWEPMIREILDDIQQAFSALHFLSSASIGKISAKFHNTLVEIMVAVAKRVGEERVLLTGGCFQNKYLTERAVHRLKAEGFCPYWHQRVPPNDGGIAFGQAIVAYYRDE
jgi:hydrogenase maturation protein HypF